MPLPLYLRPQVCGQSLKPALQSKLPRKIPAHNPSEGAKGGLNSLHTFDKDLTSGRWRFRFAAATLYNSFFCSQKILL